LSRSRQWAARAWLNWSCDLTRRRLGVKFILVAMPNLVDSLVEASRKRTKAALLWSATIDRRDENTGSAANSPGYRRKPCWIIAAWLTGMLALDSSTALAHDLFTAYIQHRVAVTLGAKHVDVTVQLTFFEDPSEHEREQMDTNGNGRLSRSEIDAYLRNLEPRLGPTVGLIIGGRPVPLTQLREPELDLLGNDSVGRGHHRLTLHFFAPTPVSISAGQELLVEDRLWPEVRALGAIQVEGLDNCRLESVPPSDPVQPPAKENQARMFKARILKAPGPQSAKTAPSPRRTP
jgi:hypothetical protein